MVSQSGRSFAPWSSAGRRVSTTVLERTTEGGRRRAGALECATRGAGGVTGSIAADFVTVAVPELGGELEDCLLAIAVGAGLQVLGTSWK
jgi:hypothetical protein